MKILILSHERSLNKAKAFILSWGRECELFLVTEREIAKQKKYVQPCRCFVVENFQEDIIRQQVPFCDFILTISENLLPLQAKLEKYYGLNQLSENAARVLANKYLFDRHCEQDGLKKFVPPSVVPQTEGDFFKVSGPVILKSTIGTGGYPMLEKFESRFQGMDYKVWNSGKELVDFLKDRNLLNSFLDLNTKSFRSSRFNAVEARMLLQSYIPSEVPSYTPCGFIKDGVVRICFYVRNHKVCADENMGVLHPPHFAKIPQSAVGDLSVTSVDVDDVPAELHASMQNYLQCLASSLDIRQLFFSGPDFHVFQNHLYAIDFNPRPGHFFNLIDHENNGLFTKLFWSNSFYNTKSWNRLRWSTVRLPQGAFLKQDQLEKMSHFMSEEMQQIDFSQLPKFQFLQSATKSLQIIATGDSEKSLIEDCNLKINTILATAQKKRHARL